MRKGLITTLLALSAVACSPVSKLDVACSPVSKLETEVNQAPVTQASTPAPFETFEWEGTLAVKIPGDYLGSIPENFPMYANGVTLFFLMNQDVADPWEEAIDRVTTARIYPIQQFFLTLI